MGDKKKCTCKCTCKAKEVYTLKEISDLLGFKVRIHKLYDGNLTLEKYK